MEQEAEPHANNMVIYLIDHYSASVVSFIDRPCPFSAMTGFGRERSIRARKAKAACATLEGAREAFLRRAKIYGVRVRQDAATD
jgi:hypothetical protein